MQRYTIFFIVVSALHVSSGFSAHHQELKNCTCSIGYVSDLFVATANVGESDSPTFEFLMMSGKTARNM
jgi:aminoglycoside N3'-acetyltransferase